MLSYSTDKSCPCCASVKPAKRVYNWHGFGYCLTCLHSIGINAAGSYCTDRQYRAAWRRLSGGAS